MDKDNEGNIWNVGKDSIYKVIVGEDKFYKYQLILMMLNTIEINKFYVVAMINIGLGGFNGL